MVVNRRGSRLAIDDEVVPVTTERGEATFALSDLGRQAGSGRLDGQLANRWGLTCSTAPAAAAGCGW
jgi:hypothetical protein